MEKRRKLSFLLSLKDEKIIKNLYARRRQVFILYENNEQQKVCALGGEHKSFDKNTTRKKEDIDLLLIQKMIFCILLR